MPRGSISPQPLPPPPAPAIDASTHLLAQHTQTSYASDSGSSSSNMPPQTSPEAGYGTVQHGSDVEAAKHHSDDEAREVGPDGETSDTSSVHMQDGVRQVEAIAAVWSKQTMIIMFVLLYLVSFIDTLLQSVQGALSPYITSNFKSHGLLGITDILATILGGVCNLAIAKVIDIWGRAEGFAVMTLFIIVGMIMKAACINIEMYAAANTIYWVGHIGIQYVIQIVYADMSTLRNRIILFGLLSLPSIAATFGGPPIANLFYTQSNFRWAFGAFTIILPLFAAPVMAIFILSKRKAKAEGKLPERVKTRSAMESVKYYFVEFDVVGMFLTIFGWCLLLLPFSLVNTAPNGWKTGYIIAMIVLGVVLLACFVVWEKYFAPVQYFPFKYLKNRTIVGACLLYGFMFLSIFTWDTYYYSYLQVVHNLSIVNASYTLNAFSLMSSVISPLTGVLIRYLGHFKWPSIAMTPFAVLGTALLIYFRQPSSHVGYLVMCQLFNGVYSGVWAMTAQLAIMASVSHQEIAVAIALFGLFGSIGASVGYSIAGGIWTNVLPSQLLKNLPDELKNQTTAIYSDISVQLSYPIGSPARDAIISSYGHVQRLMVIAGCAFLPVCIACLFMWKNINVNALDAKSRRKQGNIF